MTTGVNRFISYFNWTPQINFNMLTTTYYQYMEMLPVGTDHWPCRSGHQHLSQRLLAPASILSDESGSPPAPSWLLFLCSSSAQELKMDAALVCKVCIRSSSWGHTDRQWSSSQAHPLGMSVFWVQVNQIL